MEGKRNEVKEYKEEAQQKKGNGSTVGGGGAHSWRLLLLLLYLPHHLTVYNKTVQFLLYKRLLIARTLDVLFRRHHPSFTFSLSSSNSCCLLSLVLLLVKYLTDNSNISPSRQNKKNSLYC